MLKSKTGTVQFLPDVLAVFESSGGMKIPLRLRAVCSALFAAAFAQVSSSFASEIDLRGLLGNLEQQFFRQPNTTFYAQSVVADGSFMNSAILQLRSTSGDLVFNFLSPEPVPTVAVASASRRTCPISCSPPGRLPLETEIRSPISWLLPTSL
jgi:hypothetical protein